MLLTSFKVLKQVAVDKSRDQKRDFVIKSYLEEILLNLKPKLKQIEYTVDIDGDETLCVNSYSDEFAQIITHLVMNSLHHAYPEGGKAHLRFQYSYENGHLILVYVDNGQGIPPENLEKNLLSRFLQQHG